MSSEGWSRSAWSSNTWTTAALSLENTLSQSLHCLALPTLRSRLFFTWMRVMMGRLVASNFLFTFPRMC